MPGEQWPACGHCSAAQQLFLQLNIATLPDAAKLLIGKEEGLLQMFYCIVCEGETDSWEPFAPSHLLRIIPAKGNQQEVSLPHEALTREAGYFDAKRIIGWKAFDDYPSQEEELEDFPELSESDDAIYEMEDPAMNRSGDKLGGWPFWVQNEEYPECPKCGNKMHHIYQLDSNDVLPWMWGDVGAGHITQCANHRDILAFGWACG